MHSTIAAFSSGVPVVPMAYSRKFNGLFSDTLQYPHVADMKAQGNVEIMTIVKECLNKRAELKKVIDDRVNGCVKERYEQLTKQITKFLGI